MAEFIPPKFSKKPLILQVGGKNKIQAESGNIATKKFVAPILKLEPQKSIPAVGNGEGSALPTFITITHTSGGEQQIITKPLTFTVPKIVTAVTPANSATLTKTYVNNKLGNVKLVRAMSLTPKNPEMTKEAQLKSKIIQDFAQNGVAFTPAMLEVVSNFCTGAQKIYSENNVLLTEEILRLGKEVASKGERIKELEEQLAEAKKLDESPALPDILREHAERYESMLGIVRGLGEKFLADVEDGLKRAVEQEQESAAARVAKLKLKRDGVGSVADAGEDAKPRKCDTLSSLAQRLLQLLERSTSDEVLWANHDLNDLLGKLLDKCQPDPNLYDITESIGQIPVSDATFDGVLNNDVNMGVGVEVPKINMSSSKKSLDELSKNGYYAVSDLSRYLSRCTEEVNESGDRPVHLDVLMNKLIEVTRQCIALKLSSKSVDIFNHDYQTPLHLAVIHNASLEIISTLFKYKADVSLTDADGNTVLHHAVESETLDKLIMASTYARMDEASLHKIADLCNNEGYSPLHVAAIKGKAREVRSLISLQANVDFADKKSGRTALFHAIENNHVDVVNALREHKADPYVRNYSGTTIIDALVDSESDFTSEMKVLFYEDRAKITATRQASGNVTMTMKEIKKAKRARLLANLDPDDDFKKKRKQNGPKNK